MDLKVCGIIFLLALIFLQVIGWIYNHNGILTGSIMGLIGLIAGSIFGFKYNIFKSEKHN